MTLISCLVFLYIWVGFVVESHIQEGVNCFSWIVITFWPLILITRQFKNLWNHE